MKKMNELQKELQKQFAYAKLYFRLSLWKQFNRNSWHTVDQAVMLKLRRTKKAIINIKLLSLNLKPKRG